MTQFDDDVSISTRSDLLAVAPEAAWGGQPPEDFPEPHPNAGKIRILFVFAWLVVGGEETEVRLLARTLPRDHYLIEVLPCFRKPGMPDQSHDQLRELGVYVDTTAYDLSFEDTIDYLRRKLSRFDVVVSCQNVADIYPALERLKLRPPLIEHGGLVSEALAGPKHFTTRYVGVCDTIRAAAAARMDRPDHAMEIPSMVDLSEFDPSKRGQVRATLGVTPDEVLVGWVGRLDRKKRVEDFISAAAIVAQNSENARFIVVGGPDAFMPEYQVELHQLAVNLGLAGRLIWTGDRKDIPDLLIAMDVFCWLSRDEGMPHVIAEAGAAGLPVIATPDNGALQQITDGMTGIFVPHEDPASVAVAMLRLLQDPTLRGRLGLALQAHVRASYSAEVVVPQWKALIDEVLAEQAPALPISIFKSFVLGGWEGSTHRLRTGKRLDVVASTAHDVNARADYQQLASFGIRACRDATRWHLIEHAPDRYDFSSLTPMIEAARDTGTQVIWDLMHYGWPDDLDIWRPEFVDRFARYARAVGQHVLSLTDEAPFWCPVNEISFMSWGGGDAAYLNPFANGRGYELKCQLARAAMAAMVELRSLDPRARFVHSEPLLGIHHAAWTGRPLWEAHGYHDAQFQALELLGGWMWPQLGGAPENIDIVGVNYYWNNQWIHGSNPIDMDNPAYAPLSDLLVEVAARYGRPILIAETGTEGTRRAAWFDYVAAEVTRAQKRGAQIEGICLYPIANHPGWDDDRLCPNGLFAHTPRRHGRDVHKPLADLVCERNRAARSFSEQKINCAHRKLR